MSKEVTIVEIRSESGHLLFTAQVYEKEITPGGKQPASGSHPEAPQPKEQSEPTDGRSPAKPSPEKAPAQGKTDQAFITDAQKRYLFRILAERGIEGDKAQEHLKNLLHVNSLKQVTKHEASRAIEELLESQKGEAGHDRPPF